MVSEVRVKYALNSPKVLGVMGRIPREVFTPEKYHHLAYEDGPIPIGFGQTMSQPYTVAFMTHLLTEKLGSFEKVLEIGTGSGYQAAILSKLFKEVYTLEIVPQLARKAENSLKKIKVKNVFVKVGSGEWGWEQHSPYEAIMVTAGLEKIPEELFNQLKENGVLVAPVGSGEDKQMTRYSKTRILGKEKIKKEEFGIFNFVPFIQESSDKMTS